MAEIIVPACIVGGCLLFCCCASAPSKKPESSSTTGRRIVTLTAAPNLERPPRPVPGPILQSVGAQNQRRQENVRRPYREVVQLRTRLQPSEVCPQISDPPSYDEVVLNPRNVEGNEVRPHGSCSYASRPPSYATANRNERNGVYCINLPPGDSRSQILVFTNEDRP
jgi:hypothetical protein